MTNEVDHKDAAEPPFDCRVRLLPCPFCGKAETLDVITGEEFMDDDQEFWPHSDSYAVVCDAATGGKGGCGAMGGFAATSQAAITKWNARPNAEVTSRPKQRAND